MAGGDPSVLEQARPVLAVFASTIYWAGPLGAGHAIKAINNALSATSLAITAEMLVRARRAGFEPGAVVGDWNRGVARSQNSEVKFPRHILPGTYDSGFTVGLMEKDIATALRIAGGHGLEVPVIGSVHALWAAAVAELGPDADFTRIHEFVTGLPCEGGGTIDEMARAIAAVCLLAAQEAIPLAEREGALRDRAHEIVNASSGRSEATRAGLSWNVDRHSLAACAPIRTLGGD